ncbi:SNF2-related protein [Aliivibrio logei]|uniref:ATP-dependent helicase n=1 Tax=Aliivibrio logei 5S-186 TaxID=626086 RepID=A0ABX3AX42_ALILO|nr:SNF2-related protein [Aliivibrio logei]OEF18986.1 ATP-dependent helicase [Aliivibrio logei 5S-186]
MTTITPYHAKYFAHELSILHSNNGVDRLSQSLFDASVDLNPHQIEAALFALENPLNKGVILADEVGLGKTIEAGLVLCQYWAERKRKLLIICPASLRRQWAQELKDKFNLPSQILDAKTWIKLQKDGVYNPLLNKDIVIMSYHYAARLEDKLVAIPWDLVVIDEAHKLRNAHRDSNKMGQALKRSLNGRKKLLLTATPLQNSLIEIYGMSTIIDEHFFGDAKAFRKQFMQAESDKDELKNRLSTFVKRTLRKHVLEYVNYTQRKTLTIPFTPSKQELDLYNSITALLEKENSYALPLKQRHLTGLILRKLLASSSYAVLNTLEVMKNRLINLKEKKLSPGDDFLSKIIEDDDLETDYLDEQDIDESIPEEKASDTIDIKILDAEISELDSYIEQARTIKNDAKADALLIALKQGFEQMAEMGASKKVIIFTESKRTQQYLATYLSEHGFKDKIVTFSGTNNQPAATQIYQEWRNEHADSDRVTGSPQVDRRSALIDYFKESAEVMIATEAAAEGVNLQFCSLLINYDLPWNPQRVEQRIGRCHRYGQKFDVVVINFINQLNYADQRVLELLTNKFCLFDGVFGASDNVLGSLESGVDFEKRIQLIYQECRSPEEINDAFKALQKELEEDINAKMQDTRSTLLEHFDEDVHDILKVKLDQAKERLDKVGRWFWDISKYQLANKAQFTEKDYSFYLSETVANQNKGKYQLIRKACKTGDTVQKIDSHSQTYRLTHPLGEYVIDSARNNTTPNNELIFDYHSHKTKVSIAEQLQGQSGWLSLNLLSISTFDEEQHLVFTGLTDNGQVIDSEACKKIFNLAAEIKGNTIAPPEQLLANQARQLEAKISEVIDVSNKHFDKERERLEKWADDKIFSAEQALKDTKARRNSLKKESRLATTIEQQRDIQLELKELEVKQRKQRRDIFDLEDEVIEKRDELIEDLESRLKQQTETNNLFTIRWTVK